MKKAYLQIPEKARPSDQSLVFLDPWRENVYVIGLDRNMDGSVTVANTDPAWNGKEVAERVLVYSPGPPGGKSPLKTFDIRE